VPCGANLPLRGVGTRAGTVRSLLPTAIPLAGRLCRFYGLQADPARAHMDQLALSPPATGCSRPAAVAKGTGGRNLRPQVLAVGILSPVGKAQVLLRGAWYPHDGRYPHLRSPRQRRCVGPPGAFLPG